MVVSIIFLIAIAIVLMAVAIVSDYLNDTLRGILAIAGVVLFLIGVGIACWYDQNAEHIKECKEYRIDRIDQVENDSIVSTKYEIHYWK